MEVEHSKSGESQLRAILLPQLTRRNTAGGTREAPLLCSPFLRRPHAINVMGCLFAVVWWLTAPAMVGVSPTPPARGEIIANYLGETERVSEEERTQLALQLWQREKGIWITI